MKIIGMRNMRRISEIEKCLNNFLSSFAVVWATSSYKLIKLRKHKNLSHL